MVSVVVSGSYHVKGRNPPLLNSWQQQMLSLETEATPQQKKSAYIAL